MINFKKHPTCENVGLIIRYNARTIVGNGCMSGIGHAVSEVFSCKANHPIEGVFFNLYSVRNHIEDIEKMKFDD